MKERGDFRGERGGERGVLCDVRCFFSDLGGDHNEMSLKSLIVGEAGEVSRFKFLLSLHNANVKFLIQHGVAPSCCS